MLSVQNGLRKHKALKKFGLVPTLLIDHDGESYYNDRLSRFYVTDLLLNHHANRHEIFRLCFQGANLQQGGIENSPPFETHVQQQDHSYCIFNLFLNEKFTMFLMSYFTKPHHLQTMLSKKAELSSYCNTRSTRDDQTHKMPVFRRIWYLTSLDLE